MSDKDIGIVEYIDDGFDSRFTDIMDNVIDEEPIPSYVPQSRMEELLLELRDLIKSMGGIGFELVDTLPTTDIKTNIIYLVPKDPSEQSNLKDEYINLDGTTSGWEKIGDTEVDLSEYYRVTDDEDVINDNNYIPFVSFFKSFQNMTWLGKPGFEGNNIWTDGTNIYYSLDSYQYKLNGTTWEEMTWAGLTSFARYDVWTDGTNIYCSKGSKQYKLNGTTWEPMTWTGLTSFYGRYIWTDGVDIYYVDWSNKYYKLNGTNWDSVLITGNVESAYIWTDGTNTYYSHGSVQYKLNGTTWEPMTWTGLNMVDGDSIWTDGVDIYYSKGSTQKKLNGNAWESITWPGLTSFNGAYIWTDGTTIYYSYGSNQYKLGYSYAKKKTFFSSVKTNLKLFFDNIYAPDEHTHVVNDITDFPTIPTALSELTDDSTHRLVTDTEKETWNNGADISNCYQTTDPEDIVDDKDYVPFSKKIYNTTWELMVWGGLENFSGSNIWTDGTNIYYSVGSDQYKLNGTTWEDITWSGIDNFYGSRIWTDGTNIYYSDTSIQKKLNGATWENMTWSGLTSFEGQYIWTDGTNIYYSDISAQYKLNGTTWEPMTWSGYTDIEGYNIWTDGINIYYSDPVAQKKLNGTTWENMTWSGFTNIIGSNIWTDGTNIYYSVGSDQYKLNGIIWTPMTWSGITNFNGNRIWTDGINIYYSGFTDQYKLNQTDVKRKTLFSSIKTKLKTFFDTIYASITHTHTKSDITDFPIIPAHAEYGTRGTTTKIKIKINPTNPWMLCFVVTLYQNYRATKVMINGYNYGANHWHDPEAVIIADSDGGSTISVYFGYDAEGELWVGFDGSSYTGVSIGEVTNGYDQIVDTSNMFTITNESALTTLQTTITASSARPPTSHTHLYAGSASAGGAANDSLKLGGYSASSAATASTVALRESHGYLYATYFNQSSGLETPASTNYWVYADSSGWFRKSSLANAKSVLGAYTTSITIKEFNAAFSVAANDSASVSCTGIALSGYTPIIAIYKTNGANSKIVPWSTSSAVSNGTATFKVLNTKNSASSGKIYYLVIFYKNT